MPYKLQPCRNATCDRNLTRGEVRVGHTHCRYCRADVHPHNQSLMLPPKTAPVASSWWTRAPREGFTHVAEERYVAKVGGSRTFP